MVTYCLDDGCLAAIADEVELEYAGALIRACLEGSGIRPWEKLELDAFSLNGRTLLLARPALADRPRRYRLKN